MVFDGIDRVTKNVRAIFQRRRAALYALSLFYSAKALNDFRSNQAQDVYWTNRTFTAKDTVFSDAFLSEDEVGWFIAHAVEYGVYLELANDGRYQALKPTVDKFAKKFLADAKRIFE